MAFTTAQLASLEKAIAQGARRVRYQTEDGERQVDYQSLDQMLRVRRIMRKALGLSTGRGRSSYASFNKGLGDPPTGSGLV